LFDSSAQSQFIANRTAFRATQPTEDNVGATTRYLSTWTISTYYIFAWFNLWASFIGIWTEFGKLWSQNFDGTIEFFFVLKKKWNKQFKDRANEEQQKINMCGDVDGYAQPWTLVIKEGMIL
jgi:hypothetical protein